MTYDEARKAIHAHVAANWTGTPGDRIAYDNLAFSPPADSPWLRVTLRHADGGAVSLGSPVRRYRRFGLVTLQIFVPEGSGPTAVTLLADEAVLLFEGVRLAQGLRFSRTRLREVGVEDGWFQINVSAEYSFDDLH